MVAPITSSVAAVHTMCQNILFILAVLWYYLQRGTLTPIAVIFRQSYLLYYPHATFPTLIGSRNNSTIHSFIPSSHFLEQLNVPPAHSARRWCNRKDLRKRTKTECPMKVSIIADGPLSGPPLRQGMVILQQEARIYIGEEIGRWPTEEHLLLTFSVNLRTGSTFCLLLPINLFKQSGLIDDAPRPLFDSTITLIEANRGALLLQGIPPVKIPLSNVSPSKAPLNSPVKTSSTKCSDDESSDEDDPDKTLRNPSAL